MKNEQRAPALRAMRAWTGLDQGAVAAGSGIAERTLIEAERGRACTDRTWSRAASFYAMHNLHWREGDAGELGRLLVRQLCTLVSENDVLQDDGQAGVQIEVTPAMIEAGVHAYWENNSDDVGSAVAVHRIFSAMLLQSKALTIRSASILNECIAAITPHPDN